MVGGGTALKVRTPSRFARPPPSLRGGMIWCGRNINHDVRRYETWTRQGVSHIAVPHNLRCVTNDCINPQLRIVEGGRLFSVLDRSTQSFCPLPNTRDIGARRQTPLFKKCDEESLLWRSITFSGACFHDLLCVATEL